MDRGNLEHDEAAGLRQHELPPRWIQRAVRQQFRTDLQPELVRVMLQVMRVRACPDEQCTGPVSDDCEMNGKRTGSS
eukprot:COSAG03_NODE_893_length_5468_cov_3.850251_9_plen_77_part_00